MTSIKELATNKYFVLMFFVVGCFLGYNSAVITKVSNIDFLEVLMMLGLYIMQIKLIFWQ